MVKKEKKSKKVNNSHSSTIANSRKTQTAKTNFGEIGIRFG